MKLLVLSDTHGKLHHARKAIDTLRDRVSMAIHLGDMVADAKALQSASSLPVHYVGGNCDFYFSADSDLAAQKTLELNGVKIFLTHGHIQNVKSNYSLLVSLAKENGCAAALCGHTHEPFNKFIEGILILNPGSVSFPRGRARYPSYAVLDISDDGRLSAGVVEMR